jgi:Fic family protein
VRRDDLAHAVRRRLERLPEPFSAHYGVVPLPPPEDSIGLGQVLQRHQAAMDALARVDVIAAELKDPYLISRILPRREAVSSSAIEGTSSTLDELLSVEETGAEGAPEAAVQVRDYAHALDGLVPRAHAVGTALFTRDLVQDLHRTVMRGDSSYQDAPGALRTIVVWIGGRGDIAYSSYNPAPPRDVARCLDETIAYMRGEGMQAMRQTLVTRMAVAHAHFEAVHPFRDGNGRVGRLLLPLMMAAEGHVPLYLSPYIEVHRSAYDESLKAAQQRLDWPHAIGFIADAIVGTVSELSATRAALRELRENWQGRRAFREKSAAALALDILPHFPVITTARLADLLGVTVPAAAVAIRQLEAVGILKERTGYRRNRIFAAAEALAIINRPFGAAALLPDDGAA